jgi:O-acetyl-ADP-ribose deacetylase (regulator of RNase III)
MRIGRADLVLARGDITKIAADAIVNAANSALLGGGGVDGAIHRAGGPSIMAECRTIGGCPTGSAVATGAGALPARHVIHAVAPIYRGAASDAQLLRSAYETSLGLAESLGAKSISFPSLGTGAYGYPIREAAPIAIDAAVVLLRRGSDLERVTFVLFSEADLAVYEEALAQI